MDSHQRKLVTIVAEPVLEARIAAELRQLGATGWTVTDARGEGSRGSHAGELPGVRVRFEAVVSATVAQRIVDHLAVAYFHDYAVIAYLTDVAVLRESKYPDDPSAA